MREWQAQKEPRRDDEFVAQQLLARVAASVNRMAKPELFTEERRLILAYGGWAATDYLRIFHPVEWRHSGQRLTHTSAQPERKRIPSAPL